MKKKLVNFLILVFVGVCAYFGYNKFFGCDKSCETKDSTAVVAPVVPVDTTKKDSVKTEAPKDTTKK